MNNKAPTRGEDITADFLSELADNADRRFSGAGVSDSVAGVSIAPPPTPLPGWPFKNDYAGTAPARSVMVVTDAATSGSVVLRTLSSDVMLSLTKPNNTFYTTYCVTQPYDVSEGKTGKCWVPGDIAEVTYNGTVAPGDELGPVPNQWYVQKGWPSCCSVIAVIDSVNKIALVRLKPIEFVWVKLTEDLNECSSASAKVLVPDSNSNLCNTKWSVTVYDTHNVVAENGDAGLLWAYWPEGWHAFCRVISTDSGAKLEAIHPGTGSCCDDRCWKLTLCDSPYTESITSTDLSAYDGRVVKLDDGYCYEVSVADSCAGATTVTPVENLSDCTQCANCYHLVSCVNYSADTLDITDDLEQLTGLEGVLNIGYVLKIDGTCWMVDDYNATDCGSAESIGLINIELFDSCPECGKIYTLAECPDGDDTTYYVNLVVDADGAAFDLAPYVGKVIRVNDGITDGICYRVSLYASEAAPTITDGLVALEHYANCEDCLCYSIVECTPGTGEEVTYTDLSGYHVGDVVKLFDGSCWTIGETTAWVEDAIEIDIVDAYDYSGSPCDECLGTQKYLLNNDPSETVCTSCADGTAAADIVTTTDMHLSVGKWVKVGGTCYYVTTTTDTETQAVVTYTGPYDSCAECKLASVTTTIPILVPTWDGSDITKVSLESLVVVNGHITAVCMIEDDVSTECEE